MLAAPSPPPCACSEGERGGGEGGQKRERAKERTGVERERYSDFLHKLCGPGRLVLCLLLSPLQKKKKQDERRLCYPQPEGYAEPIYLSPSLFRA